MFYSQFILAKKGPLGTIWIAAHLERKLRKNQVADTDIGVSVDSILFPDVPIALRLSSHLLLGVVRIYSRKVNYLFDDCSEALLKIKQAFRSAAVDLPPEESTAPYHSITLPETFDLDDFELPDNENFQGNYADHHVSAREQITLQDTMDGVVYSTSQFGLDERFGDADGGQIDLDLAQGNLLEKVAAPLHDRVRDDDPEESAQPLTPFEVDMTEDISSSAPKAVLKSCSSKNQVDNLNKSSSFTEYAEAPSTPGLVQEASLCSVQEGLLSSDHLEAEAQNLSEPVEVECRGDVSDKFDNYHGDRSSVDGRMHDKIDEKSNPTIPSKENGYLSGDVEVEGAKTDDYSKSNLEQLEVSNLKSPVSIKVNALDDFSDSPDGMKNDIATTKEPSVSVTNQIDEKREESAATKFVEAVEPSPCSPGPESDNCKAVEFSLDMEMACSREQVISFNSYMNEEHFNPNMNEEHSISLGDKDASSVVECVAADVNTPVFDNNQILQPLVAGNQVDGSGICEQLSNMPPNDPLDSANRSVDMELSAPEKLVECVAADVNRPVLDKNQISQPVLANNLAVGSNACEQLHNIPPNDLLDSANRSVDVELSAPEKLLSVPDEIIEKPDTLLLESTPNNDALETYQTADLSQMSGRKRTFSESTLIEQGNSLKSAEESFFNRTETSIPDDEDLLSSILVGRRSLVLKMKPTPVPPVSSKRARTADRSNAAKRKVLVDDTLILHGDTIRQQLTSTEDLRRLRKKAPCTLPEIAIIQRHFLEEEIFSESIFTGLSRELLNTCKGVYDVRGTKICEHAKVATPAEAAKDIQSPIKPNMTGETEVDMILSPAKPSVTGEAEAELIAGPTNEALQEQVIEAVVQSDGRQIKLLHSQDINCESEGSKLEPSEKIPEMDTEKVNVVAADCSLVFGPDSQILVDSVCEDTSRLPQNSPAEFSLIEKGSPEAYPQMDESLILDNQSLKDKDYEKVTSPVDPIVENGVNCTEVAQSDMQAVIAEPEYKTGAEGFMNEIILGSSVDLRDDVPVDHCPNRHEDDGTSFTPQVGVSDQCHNVSLNGDDTVGEFGTSSIENMPEDKSQAMQLQCNIMDPADSHHGSDIFHFPEHKEDQATVSLNYENFSFQNDHAGRDEEIPFPSHSPINNYDDYGNMAVGDDTEFLNVDDDDMDQNDEWGDPEETQLLENIGWSSRTRAVAKYFQTLFNKDVLGREVLSMDNLLARKTRKEASRLFFESLVLKTRDYIQVEQEKPYDNINIRPRGKLMKSAF